MASHSLYVPEKTPGYVDQKIENDFTDKYIWRGQREGIHAIQRNKKVIEENRYLTKAITDESIAFIKNSNHQPFYLWTSYNAPHTPLQAPEEYVALYKDVTDPVKRVHYAMIKCLDDEIGRLMDFIDTSGLSENTLVILMSDNGGAEFNLTTQNGPYQGGKITNFEGGVKVPMIMRWKGVLPPAIDYRHPVHATDLFMTSVTAAEGLLPSDRPYDGTDLIKAVRDSVPAHEFIYFQMGFNRGIRNSEWKLAWNEDNADTVLFNLKNDPYERHDLYDYKHLAVKELRHTFSLWAEDNMPSAWPPVMYYHYTADNGEKYYFDQ